MRTYNKLEIIYFFLPSKKCAILGNIVYQCTSTVKQKACLLSWRQGGGVQAQTGLVISNFFEIIFHLFSIVFYV